MTIQSMELRAIFSFYSTTTACTRDLGGRAARRMTGFPLTFHNRYIAIGRQVRESLRRGSGHRPFHLEPVDFFLLPQAQHDPGIMRRQITPAAHFRSAALEAPRLVGHPRANGIAVRFLADELNTKPVVPPRGIVSQQHR